MRPWVGGLTSRVRTLGVTPGRLFSEKGTEHAKEMSADPTSALVDVRFSGMGVMLGMRTRVPPRR